MELLWTDQCFLSFIVLALAFVIIGSRKQHIKSAFQQIGQKPLAVSAGIVLLFFLMVGVLDSIRISSSFVAFGAGVKQSESLLDKLLFPLASFYEKTYSAPLALTLYSAETRFIHEKAQQVYPRLKYIKPSISKDNKSKKIAIAVIKSIIPSLLITLSLAVIVVLNKKRRLNCPITMVNRATICGLVTVFICLSVVMLGYWLSRDFHILGTGKIGQDIFYYTVKSIRTGLVIGILTTLSMFPLALVFGIAAGYFGGLIDDIIQYIYTTLSSIPGVLLITASVLSMQTYIVNHPNQFKTLAQSADARLFAFCLILGVTSWTGLCRLLRAETLKLKKVDYVTAARALGSSSLTIIRKHIIPNVMHIVLITLVLDFSFLILAEAVLSYVGVGVSPLTISWGNMINGARLELAREPIVWWPMMSAFILMFTLVLASNLFADAVRDAFDPQQSGL